MHFGAWRSIVGVTAGRLHVAAKVGASAGVGRNAMAKNVVVCCDGTANEFATDHTNVLKLFRVLDNDTSRQVVFYHPGVGTMEAVGALTSISRRVTKVLGLAFGYGLERDVCDAYAFLMQQFDPDDALPMFGFSRGAYTVRAVASTSSYVRAFAAWERAASPLRDPNDERDE